MNRRFLLRIAGVSEVKPYGNTGELFTIEYSPNTFNKDKGATDSAGKYFAISDFTESDLESAIISNLQKFLLELGKGFSFVARQKLVRTEKKDYFIDLVFYNYILKSFVLVDLKTTTITHQDVGQMDMYVRMYDEKVRGEGDNPTIGIVLCSETDDDIARYSVLHDNDRLFASKYMLYMPTEEELRKEIERQKRFYKLQHNL